MSEKKIKTIGLTGVIGAGKSSVIEILKEMRIPVLDCDSINEYLQKPGQNGYLQIVNAFGDEVLSKDLTIDKAKLSQIIFHNPHKKDLLEGIMHPLIKDFIMEKIAIEQGKLMVVEVPLLFEIKWEHYFDEVWVVSCKEELLLKRLVKHRNISEQEAKLRLSHQMPQVEKEKRADLVLYNNSNKDDLKQQIEHFLKKR